MMWDYFVSMGIDLHVKDRVDAATAERQRSTAQEILKRLSDQPGVILADEVGMGKTFVALAVGTSIALKNIADQAVSGPVVVMVPSSVKDKWPRDFGVFRERCLRSVAQARVPLTSVTVENGVEFLKLLDDPPERQKHIIFMTHGALSRGLTDAWVKLALIRRVFRRPTLAGYRKAFPRFAGQLLRNSSKVSEAAYSECLDAKPSDWRRILSKHDVHMQDDPVPDALLNVIEELQGAPFETIAAVLAELPQRESAHTAKRVQEARRRLTAAFDDVWRTWLSAACQRVRLPLLILDEAHHLKNATTRTASLFREMASRDDAKVIAGPLNGVFERMLFLTATPFQLGHGELLEVLGQFKNIAWTNENAPRKDAKQFGQQMATLSTALDRSQVTALQLERMWSRLRPEHVVDVDGRKLEHDAWWARVSQGEREATGVVSDILRQVEATEHAMREAEALLNPWVIRHVKAGVLGTSTTPRRRILKGAAILHEDRLGGLEVEGPALLPFLLAACAQARVADGKEGRALFAEGLASSYEAYRDTRAQNTARDEDVDDEPDAAAVGGAQSAELEWYLGRIEKALPRDTAEASAAHPKIKATVERVVQLWESGEKALVFCHYRATGKALERHISDALARSMQRTAMQRFGLGVAETAERMVRIGERLNRPEDPLRKRADELLKQLVAAFDKFSSEEEDLVVDVMRRFFRTPSFLSRFFPAHDDDKAMSEAFAQRDASGMTLEQRLTRFCTFLAQRATEERVEYLKALDDIQTGERRAHDVHDENTNDARLVANVRLVNGATKDDTRRRVLLAFNTPFFPEVLVASSVLAEGVDLHLDCRYVIHHDLCWNPSTIEQRTGRVDRIGAKAEQAGASIHVYLPYVAETQDEKMFRVVQDRERWFQVVMGESFKVDEHDTDRQAERVPLPAALAASLALKLGLSEDA